MFRNLTEDKTKFVQHYLSVIQKLGITSFIEKILENEVEECNDPVTLFREDSVGIRLLDHYFHTIGGGYLATVLGPTVRKLVLESKGSPDFNYDQTTLQKELSDLITTILNSSGLIPAQLHKLLYLMYHFSVQKFPKTKHIGFNAMNGFLFLRLIVPSLLQPDLHNLLSKQDLTPPVVYTLSVFAKVIQKVCS